MSDKNIDTLSCEEVEQKHVAPLGQYAHETKYLKRVQPLYDYFAKRKVRNHKEYA